MPHGGDAIEDKMMKRLILVLIISLVLVPGISDAHRMLMGYKVNELQLKVFFDDGTPAQDVNIEVYSDGKPYADGVTDGEGSYLFRPKDNTTGDITFVSSSAGHRAELALNLAEKKESEELSIPMKIAAGFGYLLGIAGLAMIYISKKSQKV